ncbi:DUF4148 domain-containing protein [Variovorax sp. ZS18.2.2]|uniref:DUF4148 domain-containing protein n=1 Tax=Variovorax sp. ZS18.2.2 TaxID=2971255 RepID=UPI002151F889|nr:DUF4148 domain-containing protein [Variovorax sp. ZS18.2.2]MCR6481107.1 DUF4148 domain-containing protein [Variovorax sp. ZS18.2.2]
MLHRTLFLAPLSTAALAFAALAPLAASAAGEYHFAPTEAGVERYPGHLRQEPSRDKVVAELEAAQKQPAWKTVSRGAPWPAPRTGQPATREAVEAEAIKAMREGTIPSGER